MSGHDHILRFVHSVQHRLNRGVICRAIQWSAFYGGLALVAGGLVFILRGYHIPWWVYMSGIALMMIACGVLWLARRVDHVKARHYADCFFDLHDGIISYVGFHSKGRDDGIYELQAEQVEDSVRKAPAVQSIPLGLSRRICICAGLLIATGLLLGFVGDSDRVQAQKQQQEQILAKTAEVNEALKDELESILREIEKEELEDPEISKQKKELQDLVKELEQVDDQRDALSQYAELERSLNKMLNSNLQRKDELLLDQVGQELKESPESKKLGQKLSQKDYKAAAEELNQYQQAFDKTDKDAMKQFAKLKTISQKMAAAASATQSKSSANRSQQTSSSQQSQNNAGANSTSSGSENTNSSDSGMSGQMTELDQAIQEYEKNDCQNCSNASEKLDRLGQSLSRLDSKRQFQQRMQSLSKKLGQCQSYMSNSQYSSLSQQLSDKAGGKGAGWGSVDSRTDQVSPEIDNGNYTSLQGLKGTGPSQVNTEESDSGGGSSARASVQMQVEYKKQAEAYIQRQDVPVEVKQGVKRYFENIHEQE